MQVVKEILEKIEKDIQSSNLNDSFSKKGEILELKDGVAIVVGLDDAMFSEIVEFDNGTR
jgi:F0F1-type ATP synthase alpha subunit